MNQIHTDGIFLLRNQTESEYLASARAVEGVKLKGGYKGKPFLLPLNDLQRSLIIPKKIVEILGNICSSIK